MDQKGVWTAGEGDRRPEGRGLRAKVESPSPEGSFNPGTSRKNPGTAKKASAEAMQIEPKIQEVLPMEIDSGPAEAEAQPMEVDEQLFPVRPIPSWAQPIMAYLAEGKLPEDEAEARRIVGRSKAYTIINGEVYHRSATTVLQRCVEPEEGLEILREIHQGECGHHASPRALIAKVFCHGQQPMPMLKIW